MNNTIKLAVASALLAAASSASAAGGIVAGDWTLDIGGNVNAYVTSTKTDGAQAVNNITTGLLPNFLSVSGKTRQNDLDVNFTISVQPGAAESGTLADSAEGGTLSSRQAFVTFGDASWGSIKLGKDLGIYASDAILSDMTLLGVGAGAASVGNTTLGRIGYGYQYADWKSQAAYSSPNFNGFQFTAGITQAWNATGSTTAVTLRGGGEPAFEGKASYSFAGDVSGKVWVSGISQNIQLTSTTDTTASAWDIGANVNVAGFGLTGYYGEGKGTGTLGQFASGLDTSGNKRDNEDWYVQATYTLPGVATKLGASYGESTNKGTTASASADNEATKDMWTFGAYHPLTKHLNLVVEYSEAGVQATRTAATADSKTISAGAILFF